MSTASHGLGSRHSLIAAHRMTPVRPMPPIVAAKQICAGRRVSSSTSPSAVSSPSDSTWAPKVPATAWFLPWMSDATSTADGDVLGAGHHRQDPAGPRQRGQQRAQGGAGLGAQNAGGAVKLEAAEGVW